MKIEGKRAVTRNEFVQLPRLDNGQRLSRPVRLDGLDLLRDLNVFDVTLFFVRLIVIPAEFNGVGTRSQIGNGGFHIVTAQAEARHREDLLLFESERRSFDGQGDDNIVGAAVVRRTAVKHMKPAGSDSEFD